MPVKIVELQATQRPFINLPSQILEGDVFIIRGCLGEIDLLGDFQTFTFAGVSQLFGHKMENHIRQVGIEKIHTILSPAEILKLTEVMFPIAAQGCFSFLKTFAGEIFGDSERFYFERKANIRFHIPFDKAVEEQELINSYVRQVGPGKVNPHGPHRDSWVNQPSNVINVWIAAGTVKTGNGLVIYPEAYNRQINRSGAYISKDKNPGPGKTFNLQAGDVLLFHGEHLHSSEINSTDCTRHVISFRVAFEKPKYQLGHYFRYAYSGLAGGSFDWLADVPQNIAWSYIRCRTIDRLGIKLKSTAKKLIALSGFEFNRPLHRKSSPRNSDTGELSRERAMDTNSGESEKTIKAISNSTCLAFMEDGRISAFERYCPHNGADLSFGTLHNGKIMCPWHNLPIDLETGYSPCRSIRKLKVYPCGKDSGLAKFLLNSTI